MAYRDELNAAHERITELERELAETKALVKRPEHALRVSRERTELLLGFVPVQTWTETAQGSLPSEAFGELAVALQRAFPAGAPVFVSANALRFVVPTWGFNPPIEMSVDVTSVNGTVELQVSDRRETLTVLNAMIIPATFGGYGLLSALGMSLVPAGITAGLASIGIMRWALGRMAKRRDQRCRALLERVLIHVRDRLKLELPPLLSG